MKTVLETTLRGTPAQEKTNLVLPFALEKEARQLKIIYSYAPKHLDGEAAVEAAERCLQRDAGAYRAQYPAAEVFLPLKNLITLSLDDPNGYRGAAHRQADSQVHILTEATASPGFLTGKLPAGQWRLVLNVHALVTPFCDCRVKIEVEEAVGNG
ncbi:MAG: hypothetical protein ACI4K6_00795 [Candidatus Fimenecus sp.]